MGRESEFVIEKTDSPKKIMVAGGGPAGMEFAVIAAQRGHDVALYEKEDQIGGQLNLAKAPPGKKELHNIILNLSDRMKLSGVKVHLNTALDVQTIRKEKPDVLVVATGARPIEIKVPGIDKPHVLNAWDVLMERVWDIGGNVVIIGGSATGCETAHFIAHMAAPDPETYAFLSYHNAEDPEFVKTLLHKSGRKITVIDMIERMAGNVGPTSRWTLMKSLKLSGIDLRPGNKLSEITDDSVIVEVGDKKEIIPADTVILALGAVSDNELAGTVRENAINVITIGDARAPRKITDAVMEGFEAAMDV